MARLRSLLALWLVLLGATFGALALSGYYNPRLPLNFASTASEGALLMPLQPRHRFLAPERPPTATPAKPKAAMPVPDAKPKVVKVAKDKPPRQAAPQWPWNIFGN